MSAIIAVRPQPTSPAATAPPSSAATIRLVAGREISTRVRQRSFLVSTAITLALLVAGILVSQLLSSKGTSYDVGVLASQRPVGEVSRALGRAQDVTVKVHEVASTAAADSGLRSGALDVVVADDGLVVRRTLPDKLGQIVRASVQAVSSQRLLAAAGVPAGTVAQALSPPPPPLRTLDHVDPNRDLRRLVAYIGTFLLYFQLLTYVITVANGVVEEKSSRIVELLLATVRPRQLLAGKVLGVGVVAMGQLLVVVAVGLVTAIASGAISVPGAVAAVVVQVLLWFLLGFALFACLYAAAGATVTRQEDLQNAVGPLNFAIIGSFIAGVYAFGSPDSTVTTVLSIIPPFSTLVMPVRAAAGGVPVWQVLAAVAVMLAVTIVLLRVAAGVYERSVLRVGARVGWRDALGRQAPGA